MTDPISYNIDSANKLGWSPDWFGVVGFDIDLITAVKAYQRFHDLTADGLVGPTTYRRIYTDREKNIDDHKPVTSELETNHIVYNGNFFPIEWDKVVLWSEENGLKAKPGSYRDVTGSRRDVKMFVNHWDVCLSSKSCQRVLDQRKISVQFLIDNDGTIYQTMDANHIAWHAGSRSLNNCTVGVEISNAYYLRHNEWYERKGFGRRPICTGSLVNGHRLEAHLGFYPEQIEALKALWRACNDAMQVPLQTIHGRDGLMSTDTEPVCANGTFRGIVHHYHLTNRKTDCGGLDILQHLEDMIDDGRI